MGEEPPRWHEAEEAYLKKLQHQCEELHKHNMKEHLYYDRLSNKFNIPILVISAINSLCAVSLNSFLEQKYVSVLNAILSASTGALGSIQLFLKVNEKTTKATRAALGFKRISLKISKELALDRQVRTTEGPTFVTDCFTDYNQVLEAANPIEKKLQEFLSMKPPNGVEEPPSPFSSIQGVRSVANRLMMLARSKYSSSGERTPEENISINV
jgi:hypothetical protein